jgi:predicted peptidase
MNSIKRFVLTLAAVAGLVDADYLAAADLPLEKREFTDAKGKVLRYRLLRPDVKNSDDPKKAYPLVLFLHGAGERGDDNDKQLVHGVPDFAKPAIRKEYPCFLIAPQCPAKFKWVDVDWSADSHKLPAEPTEPLRQCVELIAALQKEFAVDGKRIYVTGLSMGGYGAWDILVRHPELFAAAAPVCGGGDEATAGKIAKIPVWAFHGAKDGVVKPARSRNMVEALKKAGGTPKYTEYPTVGHDSWVPTYRDPELYKWLFAQKRE